MGQTRDVTTRGACIRTTRNHMPEINSPLILMLIPEIEPAFLSSDTAIRIEGKVDVQERNVTVEGGLPFIAMLLKGQIEQSIRDELATVLAAV